MSVLRNISNRETPQSEPAAPGQVVNDAGGYTFELNDWDRLTRFLVLGVDAGTYYTDARTLALDNARVITRCLDADPARTVKIIADVSFAGRAPNNDPALFALAVAFGHPHGRQHVDDLVLLKVARTGTHLFHFAQFVEGQRGWGRALRTAVSGWYERDDIDHLAYQVVKYRQRDGWSHRDLLRLAHPAAPSDDHRHLYDLICGRDGPYPVPLLEGAAKLARATDEATAAELVREYGLPWETVPSELRGPKVWNTLIEADALPVGAMVRNLGVMTAKGVLTPGSKATRAVTAKLGHTEQLRRARLHPVAVLNALLTYSRGTGLRGKLSWNPVAKVTDTLDAAFYKTFKTVEPAGKRTVLGLDVSGSMSQPVAGTAFNAREGAAAMAMTIAASEPETIPVAFTAGSGGSGWGGWRRNTAITPLDISPRRRLDDNIRIMSSLPFGGTDCSLPMLWALDNKVEADTFIILTDSETWAGRMHPHEALVKYREQTGIPARLVVVGMTSTGFTIADPNDGGMMDVVGMDTAAPDVIAGFSAGRF